MVYIHIYESIYCLELGGGENPRNLEKQADNQKENSFSNNSLFGLLRVKSEYTYPVFSKAVTLCKELESLGLGWGDICTGAKWPSLNVSEWLHTFKHGGVLIRTG